jgi:hypothetical protein
MRAAWLAGIAALGLGAGGAWGQYVDFDAVRLQNLSPGARPSVRLAGMGQLGLVVEDENNEINLSDFGANLAGVAEDRDGWSLESWVGQTNSVDDYLSLADGTSTRVRNRVNRERAGTEAVYRKPGKRAIGVTALYDSQDNTLTGGPRSKIDGPNVSFLYNEISLPVAFAARVGTWSDNQSLVSSDIFAIRNFSTGWFTSFASAIAWRGWKIGGQLDLDRVRVFGRSRDPDGYHQDDYTWNRPASQYRFSLIRPEGSRLAAGLNITGLRRNGNEEGKISWSNRFPPNPSRANYLVRIPTFEETERDLGAEGRVLYQLLASTRLAGYGSYQKLHNKVTEDPSGNFPGSRRQQDNELKGWRLGGGVGFSLLGRRLTLGVEGFGEGRTLNSKLATDGAETKARTFAVHAGAEWLLPSRIAIRGGVTRGAYDENLDQPLSLYTSNGLSAGLGYVPLGGIFSLDAAYRFLHQKPDFQGGSDRTTDVQELTFAARFLL